MIGIAARSGMATAAWLFALATGAAHADLRAQVDAAAAAVEEQVIGWRRHIHEHPELSNRERQTAELVAAHLEDLGLEVTRGVAHTGVVGLLRGAKESPVVALRADMDALPVVERTGLPYASKVKSTYNGQEVGVMHACGHDTHVAILMGVATVLSGLREQLPGAVKFIFQPAEEGPPKGEDGGARMMVQAGVLKNPEVSAIFGLHVSQAGPVGSAQYRPEGAMASAQRLDIRVQGRQTHGARPWAGVDPIVAGASIITALQTIVSRQVDITRAPAVVTILPRRRTQQHHPGQRPSERHHSHLRSGDAGADSREDPHHRRQRGRQHGRRSGGADRRRGAGDLQRSAVGGRHGAHAWSGFTERTT